MVAISERPEEDRKFFLLPAPYKLSGPSPDVTTGDPMVIYKLGQHRHYCVNALPGLVLTMEPLGNPPGCPRWMVMFHEDDKGRQVFAEAGCGDMVIRSLWDFVEYVLTKTRRGNAPTPVPVAVPV